jgi:hypothetical protein
LTAERVIARLVFLRLVLGTQGHPPSACGPHLGRPDEPGDDEEIVEETGK